MAEVLKNAGREVGMDDFKKLLDIAASERRNQMEGSWGQAYRIIRCLQNDDYPLDTNYFYGLTTVNIYNKIARLYGGVFGTQGVIYIRPNAKVDDAHAKWLTDKINGDLKTGRFNREFLQVLLELGFYGTGLVKLVMKSDKRSRRARGEERRESVSEYPRPLYLPNEDFLIDVATGWDIRNCGYCFHTYPTSWGEIQAEQKDGAGYSEEGLKELEEAGRGTYGSGFGSTSSQYRRWNRRIDTESGDKYAPVWIEEGWFNCGDHWEVITAAQIGTGTPVELLYQPESPHWWIDGPPVYAFRAKGLPNEFYGLGDIEPSKGLQQLFNDQQNLKNEISMQIACPPYIAPPGSPVTSEMLQFTPNSITICDPELAPRPLNTPGYPNGLNIDAAETRQMLEAMQNTPDIMKGDAVAERTAAQTMMRLQEAKTGSSLDIEDIGNGLEEMTRGMIALYYQHGDEMEDSRYMDIVDPEDYDVDANLSTAAIKELRINQLMQMYSLGEKALDQRQKTVLLRAIMVELEQKEADEIFPPDQPIEEPLPVIPDQVPGGELPQVEPQMLAGQELPPTPAAPELSMNLMGV